jgi:tRNA-2-methylthio-N6-dimethylallyladenosine synthase
LVKLMNVLTLDSSLERHATEPARRLVSVITFGCQMNEYDSQRVIKLLADLGFSATEDISQADLIFVNTCSIREKAVQKLYSFLGRLKPLKASRPDLTIVVAGCLAQQEGKKMIRRAPIVDVVVGTHGLNRLPDLVRDAWAGESSVVYTDFDYDLSRPEKDAGTAPLTAFLTVMQGCNNFCSYCIVPYVRGREISREPDDIVAEAEALVAHGTREITLLGQNVNSYGRGLDRPTIFADLVARVADIEGLWRLRFTTSHPKDLSDDLIRAIADLGPMCEHVHLPVQSGSNRILAAMRRGYTTEDYLDRVERLRNACPDLALTTDIIVGFPGETDEDFRATMNLVHQVRYDGMFSFKYSDRPRTLASKMDGKVDETVKSDRLLELQTTQKEITIACNQSLVGRPVEILVEGRSVRYPEQLTGRTRGNKIVNFKGPDRLIGRLAETIVTNAWANSLRGRLRE